MSSTNVLGAVEANELLPTFYASEEDGYEDR